MRIDCKSCEKWKEQMYWSQVHVIQFLQILSGIFDQQLVIPQKIAKHLKEKLESYVRLTGPSGSTWKVGLTAIGETLILKHGWKEFVDAHSLKVSDLLIFKYTGDSHFDVSVFDSQSSCEKEASFFIKKCEHADVASGSRAKRPIAVTNDTTNDVSEATGKSFPHEECDAPATKKFKASAPTSHVHTSKSSSHYESEASQTSESSSDEGYESDASQTTERRTRSKSSARVPPRANANLRSRKIKSTSTRVGGDTSTKHKALDSAKAAATANSCVVVMHRSHVKGTYYMTVPIDWARLHLPHNDIDVILRYDESTWKAKLTVTDRGFALTGDWKKFAIKNHLNISDVCVFKLAGGENEDTIILDVSIFRQE